MRSASSAPYKQVVWLPEAGYGVGNIFHDNVTARIQNIAKKPWWPTNDLSNLRVSFPFWHGLVGSISGEVPSELSSYVNKPGDDLIDY